MAGSRDFGAARWLIAGMLAITNLVGWCAAADAPRVLPAGKTPADSRLARPKDYDGYFPFTPSKSKAEWDVRAERARRQLLVATGLWPMPARTPAGAVVHGKVQRDGYTVEKVFLESYPGHFVTGNLYRPTGKTGRLAGVLCPHGHSPAGRFTERSQPDARKAIMLGEERFENGARSIYQARCVTLARMGCVVFHYDMIGYADSQQIPQALAHGFAKQRPEFDTPQDWGLFSTQAELRQQSVMGIQTYNSVRASTGSANCRTWIRPASASPAKAAAARRPSSCRPSIRAPGSAFRPLWFRRPCRGAARARAAVCCGWTRATSSSPR